MHGTLPQTERRAFICLVTFRPCGPKYCTDVGYGWQKNERKKPLNFFHQKNLWRRLCGKKSTVLQQVSEEWRIISFHQKPVKTTMWDGLIFFTAPIAYLTEHSLSREGGGSYGQSVVGSHHRLRRVSEIALNNRVLKILEQGSKFHALGGSFMSLKNG